VKFTKDPVSSLTIRRVEPGRLGIGEATYEQTVALTTDSVLDDLDVSSIAELGEEDLEPLLDTQPEVIVVGTGWSPARPPRELVFSMARRGIGLEIMDTPAACRTFNILVAEGRRPAALLIV